VPTSDNLQEAFAGESQANRKYLAFAQKADAEGYPQIARLFRAVAAAETVHALAHFRAMGGAKSTAENLQAAVEGEAAEFQKIYPAFLSQAQDEGNKAAANSFQYAMSVEEVHHRLYSEAARTLADGKDLPATKVWVCGVCGNTVYGAPPDRCPICGAKKEKFFQVE